MNIARVASLAHFILLDLIYKRPKGLPLETKNTQNHENRRHGLIESLHMFLPIIIKLSQTVWGYGLHKILTSGEIVNRANLSFLHATLLPDLRYVPSENYQVIKQYGS